MICSIILTYTLILMDNNQQERTKYLDKVTTNRFVSLLKDKKFLEKSGIKSVSNLKIEEVKPFDCYKGPKVN